MGVQSHLSSLVCVCVCVCVWHVPRLHSLSQCSQLTLEAGNGFPHASRHVFLCTSAWRFARRFMRKCGPLHLRNSKPLSRTFAPEPERILRMSVDEAPWAPR